MNLSTLSRAGLLWLCCLQSAGVRAQDQGLVVHLPLEALPVEEVGPNHLKVNVTGSLQVAPGRKATTQSLAFPGRDAGVSLADVDSLHMGQGDFTLSAWLHTDERLTDDLGDVLGKYDGSRRNGFLLGLRCNSGVASSQSNWRQLQFGIDNGQAVTFRDEGRPGQAILVFSLCAHDGQLFAGTCEPQAGRAGRVYRYVRPNEWADLGTLDGSNSVSAMAAWKGTLYAGTAKYRLRGSALAESPNETTGGSVFRFDGHRWNFCGKLPETEAVGCLVVYDGRLYASSLYAPAGFFRYEGEQSWTRLPVPEGKRVEALGVFNGMMYAGSYDGGKVYRYDGKEWVDLGTLGDNTQTYSFATFEGRLHVGTWPSGKVFRLAPSSGWEDTGRLGNELEVMGMAVHNGQLYAGTLPLAEIYRRDPSQWTRLGQLDSTADVKYRRVWTMAQYQGRLFCTTLPSGHVHSLQAGVCVTHDREIPPGWHHVAAVRKNDRLELHVDGSLVARSEQFSPAGYDLTNTAPLRVGHGPVETFNGRLQDVRVYRRALTSEEIQGIANQ